MPQEPGEEVGITSSRTRSTIAFPYNDLDDAVAVADAMYRNVGAGSATMDQVAAWTGHSTVDSGAFKLKVAAARTFGLLASSQQRVSLTDLGRRAVNPDTAAPARKEAFLTVPLYRALYDQYRGHLLPPDTALEREIETLGVSPKQTSKARQAFQRSAQQAGFADHGRNRLVAPSVAESTSSDAELDPIVASDVPFAQMATGLHPFIQGLLATLPAPGTRWPQELRQRWLATAENVFSLIYTDDQKPG